MALRMNEPPEMKLQLMHEGSAIAIIDGAMVAPSVGEWVKIPERDPLVVKSVMYVYELLVLVVYVTLERPEPERTGLPLR